MSRRRWSWDHPMTVAPPERRRLYRSTQNRVLAGVCAGLAQHLDLDVRLVRGALAALSLLAGAGLILYGAFWAVVPQTHDDTAPATAPDRRGRRRHDRGDLLAF